MRKRSCSFEPGAVRFCTTRISSPSVSVEMFPLSGQSTTQTVIECIACVLFTHFWPSSVSFLITWPSVNRLRLILQPSLKRVPRISKQMITVNSVYTVVCVLSNIRPNMHFMCFLINNLKWLMELTPPYLQHLFDLLSQTQLDQLNSRR